MQESKIIFFTNKLNEIKEGRADLMTWYKSIASSLPDGAELQKQFNQFIGAMKIGKHVGRADVSDFFGSEEGNKKQSIALLESYIERLKSFDNSEKASIVLNVHQSVNINILIDTIKDELTGKQYQRLQEIVKSSDPPETKREKVINALKSFGENVLSNIVATILLKLLNIPS